MALVYLEVAEVFVVVLVAGLRVVAIVLIVVHYFQLVLNFNFYPSVFIDYRFLSAEMSYRQTP